MATIAQLLTDATARIRSSGSDTPRLDAEVLYRQVADLDRTGLFLAIQNDALDGHVARFNDLVERRIAGQPVAYLVGQREFMGMSFRVTPDVLIPRPETELLVEWALAQLDIRPAQPINVVDVGAGSGAIAVSMTALGPTSIRMLAIEPSRGAREVMARNTSSLLTTEQQARFNIADGDLLSKHKGRFGMVLANLPYLTPEQLAGNPDLAAEPRIALDGGSDGLTLIHRLIGELPDRLGQPFAVGLEIDPSQADTVVALLGKTIPESDITVIKDLAGFDRHVVALTPAHT